MVPTERLLKILDDNESITINQIMKEFPDMTFVAYLESMMEKKKMTKSELVHRSNLSRTYVYQIINGTRVPGKDKVIQLAFALHLNLNETNHLLMLSNNGSLYPKIKRDAIIIYAINHHLSILDTNELLSDYNMPILE